MSATIIDGKEIAKRKRMELKAKVEEMKKSGKVPGLAVLLVGENPASMSYVKGKIKDCEEVGMHSILKRYQDDILEADLLREIEACNQDEAIHGILVQLPLPIHISDQKVIETIRADKDVDGFHPINLGKMLTGQKTFLPCTPYGIVELLETMNISAKGKHVVIVGRSNLVGKPAGQLLLNKDATVTYCHSKTKNMKDITRQADILVVAVGKAGLIDADAVKEGAVVIDVGVNRNEEGKLVGDVLFDEVKEKAGYITPVPGGVGPMTRLMLLVNTLQSAESHFSKE